jgi:hypothetical protein
MVNARRGTEKGALSFPNWMKKKVRKSNFFPKRVRFFTHAA